VSNAYLQLAKTTQVPAIIRRACVFAQLPDNSDKWKWLAAEEKDALTELANIYNDAVRDLYNELPLINVTSATLTTVASQAYVSLPTDFRDSDILALYWSGDSTSWTDGVELTRISPADAFSLPAQGIGPADTDEYPSYFSLAWDTARLNLYPTPSAAKTLTILYRAKETATTITDVKAGATTISQIPDAMVKLLAIVIAMDLCDRSKNQPRVSELSGMLARELDTWRDKLAGDMMSLRTNVFQTGGLPRTPDEAMI
jgi:hypothetical protein